MPRIRRPRRNALLALGGGLLVALPLPPWGLRAAAFVGIMLFESSLDDSAPTGRRFQYGWLFGAAWLFTGMVWMWFRTPPGYIIAAGFFAALHGLAAMVSPVGPWRVIGRPAAHTLVEALRFSFPFGGVPLASLAISQSAGPLVGVVRIGGALLLTWVTFQIGFGLGALAERRARIPASIGVVASLLLLAIA